MSTPVQLSLAARPHNNQQLFSDHYLDVTLPQRADWRALAALAEPVMREIASIFAGYKPSNNEAQTEDDLIKPVLKALGHTYEVQASLRTPDGTKTPDYIFYRDEAARLANKNKTLTDELPKQGAFAVGDAKYWDRPLDQAIKSGTGDPFTNKNPSYQIAFYIQHSGLDWGILTNGRKWRLYHKASAHKLDRFYEVDLPELLASNDTSRFLYFYAFFHRSAFEPHPLGVAAILQESADYAQGVGDTLKSQVYEALRHLAQGFLDYAPNGLEADPATLKKIYDASLIVLYRMLFILYAEARELLPLYESPQYRTNYSLKSLKEGVALSIMGGSVLLSDSATLWPRLRALFGIINAGSPPLKVATFNGGLFDPKKHPFLEQHTVGDGHLQQAIDKLARVKEQFVDYRDLAVRHLGTIYEGLLEYHLEPLEPLTPDGGWSIDLLNDKGERKATGSYYTPDYIVKYIVDQTLGPVLESAVNGLEDDAVKAEAVLSLNVLDPAMGSGHFLVEANEYIAGYMVELGIHPPGSTGDETDLAYWKRRVAQSCIYGVDLNPLAVELAKLSLWLSTVAKDRPLSFLDHHLRAGNSLIGARIADLRLNASLTAAQKRARKQEQQLVEAGYRSMLEDDAFRQAMSIAVGSMWLIEENPGLTVDQVKEQEQVYGSLRETLTRKYGRLADLVTASYFGLKVDVDPQQWQTLADYATGRAVAALPQFVQWLQEADAIAEQRRFFHWELEFPEVFFGRNGQPLGDRAGFDAVIGNPPYVRVRTLKEQSNPDVQFFESGAYKCAVHVWDLYLLICEKGLALANPNGNCGFIVPIQTLHQPNCESLRELIIQHGVIKQIFDVSQLHIFDEALVKTCILIYGPSQKKPEYVAVKVASSEDLQNALSLDVEYSKILTSPNYSFKPDLFIYDSLLSKTEAKASSLGDLFYVTFGLRSCAPGVGAGGKDRLILASHSTAQAQPYMEGREISRYMENWQGRYIDYLPKEMYSPRSPELFETEKLITQSMLSAKRIVATYDKDYKYVEQSLVCIVRKVSEQEGMSVTTKLSLLYVLALLNSTLSSFYFAKKVIGDSLGGGLIHATPGSLVQIPIRHINFATPPDQRTALAEKGRELYERGISEHSHQGVLDFVEHHLSQEPEGLDVVHDLLAYLAQQMLDLNKQRHKVVEDFVLDLEGVLSPADLQKIGRLWTPTARAEPTASLHSEAQAQLGPLVTRRLELRDDIGKVSEDQWKWLLRGRLKRIPNLADLVRVYRQRQPAIAELDGRIAFTDSLIDAIVYRLYGLTEDEVAIVEGRAG